MASLIQKSSDYTDKDFDSMLLRLQNLARSAFPDWTDFAAVNFGNLSLQLFAFCLDVVLFYLDNQALQARIDTATQRKVLLGLCKLIGFTPSGASAASTLLTVTLGEVPAFDVLMVRGSQASTEEAVDPIVFEYQTDLTILAGTNPPVGTVTIENSAAQIDLFQASGLPNQPITLLQSPYLDGTAAPAASNGSFTKVDNFLNSTAGDRHFIEAVDQNDVVTITFGNGINGALPTGTIVVPYKTGGGIAGDVDADTITKLLNTFTDTHGNPVTVGCTNLARATGGADRMTVAQIKEQAPQQARVAQRTVSREDFQINARRITGVARALMVTSNEDPGIVENTGNLYIIPVGGGVPSSLLLSQVLTEVTVTYPCTLTFKVFTLAAQFLTVNVGAIVYLKPGANATNVRVALLAALKAFFAIQNPDGTDNTNVDFGVNYLKEDGTADPEITWSDIEDVVHDVAGIRKIDDGPSGLTLNGVRTSLAIGLRQFPVLGTVTIINGATGLAL